MQRVPLSLTGAGGSRARRARGAAERGWPRAPLGAGRAWRRAQRSRPCCTPPRCCSARAPPPARARGFVRARSPACLISARADTVSSLEPLSRSPERGRSRLGARIARTCVLPSARLISGERGAAAPARGRGPRSRCPYGGAVQQSGRLGAQGGGPRPAPQSPPRAASAAQRLRPRPRRRRAPRGARPRACAAATRAACPRRAGPKIRPSPPDAPPGCPLQHRLRHRAVSYSASLERRRRAGAGPRLSGGMSSHRSSAACSRSSCTTPRSASHACRPPAASRLRRVP